VWIPEVAGRDPFVHLALLLSATRDADRATGIANIWARDAVATSGAVKGLTEAFPERMLLGLGVSPRTWSATCAGTIQKPLTAMRRLPGASDRGAVPSCRAGRDQVLVADAEAEQHPLRERLGEPLDRAGGGHRVPGQMLAMPVAPISVLVGRQQQRQVHERVPAATSGIHTVP